MRSGRVGLYCGIAGPAAFTASWAWAGFLQHGRGGYTVAREHISGLGAPDALAPWVVNAGFVALGACTVAFAGGLDRALRGPGSARPGAARLAVASLRRGGGSAAALGLLRRDRMLLAPAGGAGALQAPSWHNHGHDAVSALGYGCLVLAPLLVGRRALVPGEASHARGALATSAATSGLLALFASRRLEPYNGIVQRVAVTLPLWWMSALAIALLRRGRDRDRPEERRT
jgi:hypothetical protein